MFLDEIQVGHELAVWWVGVGIHSLIFCGVFEFVAGELRALGADFKPLFLNAAGYDGTGWVFIEEVGSTAAGASGRSCGIVSGA